MRLDFNAVLYHFALLPLILIVDWRRSCFIRINYPYNGGILFMYCVHSIMKILIILTTCRFLTKGGIHKLAVHNVIFSGFSSLSSLSKLKIVTCYVQGILKVRTHYIILYKM